MGKRTALETGLLLAGIGLFLRFSDAAGEGIRAGLSFCGRVLIPSLFPVSVLAGCMIRLHAADGPGRFAERWMRGLFGLPGAGALPLLLGMLGGFPLGAQLAASACKTGQLSRQEAARLAGLCNNAGPAFLLGTAGAVLGAPGIGLKLLLIQLASVLLTGLIFRRSTAADISRRPRPAATPEPMASVLSGCMAESATAMLRLTGAVAFFQAVCACLIPALQLSRLPALLRALVFGMLELTGGLAALGGIHSPAALPLAAFLICWGGFCVHLQAIQVLAGAELPIAPYLKRKLLQAGIALLLAIILA